MTSRALRRHDVSAQLANNPGAEDGALRVALTDDTGTR
jgi:hypothetical protein